jgi:hypothetical protein
LHLPLKVNTHHFSKQITPLLQDMPLENEAWAQAGISMPVLPASQQGPSHAANQRLTPSALSPPPPAQGFSPYSLMLAKLLAAGFDMKNRDDHTNFVVPVLQECGGSLQAIASSIGTNLNGGLTGSDHFAARKVAYGHNRIPELPMVRLCPFSAMLLTSARSLH